MTPEGSGLTHSISPLLTNIAVGIMEAMSNQYIAKQVFPNVAVAAPSGTYNVWKRGDFMRRQAKKLQSMEAPPIIGFATGTGTFAVARYGASTGWTSQDLANARIGGIPDQKFINGKLRLITETNLIELEIQTASLVQTAGNWSSTFAGVSTGPTAGQFLQWDQTASSPVDDVLAWKEAMRLGYGIAPNCMIIPQSVWLVLRKNQSLIARITYSGTMEKPTQVSMNQLKALFEIDNIIVPSCVYNTGGESDTPSYSYIWGAKTVWLGFVADAPSQDAPSAGYHFSWTGNTQFGLPYGTTAGGEGPQNFGSVENADGLFIREYIQNRPAAHFVDAELFTTPNVVAADMGMTATAVIA